MISLEEREKILDEEVEWPVEKGWKVEARTETTCFLSNDNHAMGCLSMLASMAVLFPFFEVSEKTRSVEVDPEGHLIRSWFKY